MSRRLSKQEFIERFQRDQWQRKLERSKRAKRDWCSYQSEKALRIKGGAYRNTRAGGAIKW